MRPRNTSRPLGFHPGQHYRTVSEALILDMCHVAGWACERGESSPGMAITCEALECWIGMGLEFRPGADGARYFDPVEVLISSKVAVDLDSASRVLARSCISTLTNPSSPLRTISIAMTSLANFPAASPWSV